MKKSQFIIFFTIVFSLYWIINFYIFISGWNAVPNNCKIYYLITFLFLSLSFIAGRFLERKSLNWFSSFLVWIGSFWLAAFVYFLLFILLIDIFRIINYVIPFFPSFILKDYTYTKQILFVSFSGVILLIVIAGYINARSLVITELNLIINKKAGNIKSLTAAIASDIHLGTIICKSRLEKIVEKINSLNADIVLLPGDVVDEDIGPVIKQNLGEVLRNIKSRYGVYAVTGNHEYIGGVEPACKYLTEHGIVVLRDSYVNVADSFYIVGREDRSIRGFTGKTRKRLEDIIEGIDKNLPIILMDHQPVKLVEAEKNGVDLQLSGHTHHGQLWPFNFITKKVYELSRGYLNKGNTHYYVSCGVGTWGPPIRTGNRPEIILLNLRFVQGTHSERK
ncbi:MAG TPA: metallophosphoesterase [Ignavibacteria bacterium]|nr:metallophosphoesterase [Ignavibacteria bacterium]